MLLGAGLDSRAFRLPWTEGTATSVFEVDAPHQCAYKEEILARYGAVSRCRRTMVPADFREDWQHALCVRDSILGVPPPGSLRRWPPISRPIKKTVFCALLPPCRPPAGWFATEHWQPTVCDAWSAAMRRRPAVDYLNSLIRPGCSGEPGAWFAFRGWRTCVFDLQERAEDYGRPMPPTQCVRDAARAMRNCRVNADKP